MNGINAFDLKCFHEFYNGLENKKDIFYMYFTGTLLHYAIESAGLVPNDVNLVLITSDLTQNEIITVKEIIKRPHINLCNKYHDGYIWDMLVAYNKYNFGWIDVDCFIYNPELFNEIRIFSDNKTAINTVWARKYDEYSADYHFSNTYFLFININIFKYISSLYNGVTMMPSVYKAQSDQIVFEAYRAISDELFGILNENYKNLKVCLFDTTHLYQILFFMNGFNIKRIRNLDQLAVYYSQEALHLGGCHLIHRYILDNSIKRLYFRFNMRFSYYLLYKNLSRLPCEYQQFYEIFTANIISNRLNSDVNDVIDKIRSYAERNGVNTAITTGR